MNLNTRILASCVMSSKGLKIMVLLLLCVALIDAQPNQPRSSDKSVRNRIEAIVQQRLLDGAFMVDGNRAQTRIPPSDVAVAEIKRYGDSAVPVLAGYSHSKSTRERRVAVEFLGLLGGSRIVAPLQRVIKHDPSPAMRELALRGLTQAPPHLAQPIIRRTAKTDPD